MCKAEAILKQIGWRREDRTFLSLNLTDEQVHVVSQASEHGGNGTAEERLCYVLQKGLDAILARKPR